MSIRPIELQLAIPKSFDASKEQQNILKKGDIESQQKALSANEEIAKRMNSVNGTDKSEKKDLLNDSKENKNGQHDKSKSKTKEETKMEEQIPCFTPGKLDIKI